MASQKMQKAALVTRYAHQALLDLKKLMDSAAQKIRAAELEAVGHAIGSSQAGDALINLRSVAETIGSSKFESAVWQARKKIPITKSITNRTNLSEALNFIGFLGI